MNGTPWKWETRCPAYISVCQRPGRIYKRTFLTMEEVPPIVKSDSLNQPRIRQLVLDIRVVDGSRDEAGDAKGGLHDDHGQQ